MTARFLRNLEGASHFAPNAFGVGRTCCLARTAPTNIVPDLAGHHSIRVCSGCTAIIYVHLTLERVSVILIAVIRRDIGSAGIG